MDESVKNERQPGSASLPAITLVVLIGLIAALLYIGYDSLADNTGNAKELTNVPLDTTDQALTGQTDNPEDLLPDTSSTPAPVDLSQAPAPDDNTVADGNERRTEGRPAADDDDNSDGETAATATATDAANVPETPKPTPPKPSGTTSTYTVGDGETFYGVANRLNMKVSTLKEMNPGVSENEVKSGVTKLKVRIRTVHTVGPGDVLRVVAAKYGVTKEAIMKANHKTKDFAARGEKLIIPLPAKE